MKPRVNNPAWVRAIQDVIDVIPAEPPDQINADPNTTGFQQFLAGTGSMLAWWGDIGSNAKTNDASVIGDVVGFAILPGSDDVYNHTKGQWEKLPSGPNYAPNMAYLGWGIYVMARVDSDPAKHKAAWSAAAHLGGKDLSLWCAAYPSGFQPYRNSHFNIPEWVAAGYDEAFITDYLESQSDSYNHPNAAIEPRIPGIFQYYSVAEDELAKIFAGQFDAQTGADNIAAAWEKLTDQIGRKRQIELYKASLGVLAPSGLARGWRCRTASRARDQVSISTMAASTTGRRPTARRRGGRAVARPAVDWPGDPAGRLAGARGGALVQILDQAGTIALGFETWRPLLYAFVLWAIALCVAQVMIRRRGWACAPCSCCRQCCSPSRW